jgi:uncharacterized protein (DUF2237 family)
MPLPTGVIYAREQIAIPPYMLGLLKEYQKAVLRQFRGKVVSNRELLDFSHAYFLRKDDEFKARLRREEEYRREWTGKKGEVRELFRQFEANGDCTVDFSEIETALLEVKSFFGYSMSASASGAYLPMDEEMNGRALFSSLDLDGDGCVGWDEFWSTISAWMDSHFDKAEAVRTRVEEEGQRRQRVAAEEEARHEAQDAAIRAAETTAALLDAAHVEAERERAERARAAAERADVIRRAEEESAERLRSVALAQRRAEAERHAAEAAERHAVGLAREQPERAERTDREQRASAYLQGHPEPTADELARARALATVRSAAANARSVDELLPALVAALADVDATGASALDSVALGRVPRHAATAAAEPPLFVAIAPMASGAETASEATDECPLLTVVWATPAHPAVARGRALQRITERPTEQASFAALDSALPASNRRLANEAGAAAGRDARFVATPLRQTAVGRRGRALGVVGSGALADASLAHNPAICQFVALRRLDEAGGVGAEVVMASPAHPLPGVVEGERWTDCAPGGAPGGGGGLAAAVLSLFAAPPAELLAAAAAGETAAQLRYQATRVDLGIDSAETLDAAAAADAVGAPSGGFVAASVEVRLWLLLDPACVAAAALDDEAARRLLDASAVLGVLGVGPEAAQFAPAVSAGASGSGADGAPADADNAEAILQVVAANRAAVSAASRAAGDAPVGAVLRSPLAVAEAAAAGAAEPQSALDAVAYAAYRSGAIAVDREAGVAALALVGSGGRTLGVATTRAPPPPPPDDEAAAAAADASLAFLRELGAEMGTAVAAVEARERAASEVAQLELDLQADRR